jgi:hypothetical protein
MKALPRQVAGKWVPVWNRRPNRATRERERHDPSNPVEVVTRDAKAPSDMSQPDWEHIVLSIRTSDRD